MYLNSYLVEKQGFHNSLIFKVSDNSTIQRRASKTIYEQRRVKNEVAKRSMMDCTLF